MEYTVFNHVKADDLTCPIVTATTVTSTEVNGKTDGILVIATMATDDVTLTDAQKKNALIEVTAGHATNVLTLGLDAGKSIVVKNNDATTEVLVKNIAEDSALTLAATKTALIVSGTGGAMRYVLTA